MNKKIIYRVTLLLFLIAIVFIIVRSNKEQGISYELKERKGNLAKSNEYILTRASADRLQLAIKENPEDKKSLLGLAALYIQEARITGDHVYYDMAALQQVNNVLKIEPENFEALTYKALVYLSQHHFAEGLEVAEKAREINPYNAFIYGLLVDANVEMGNYKKAVENSDSMVSIRPDIRSYSRISYLREIYGDNPGAIEAMKLAVGAGMQGEEGTEWARVQLGHLYENTGDIRSAEMHYTIALDERPDYAYAIAGMARIATAKKDYTKAIHYYLKAYSLVEDNVFNEELVDVYRLAGQNEKAEALARSVIENMNRASKAELTNGNIGHYSDRELAYAYLKVNDNDKALAHALAEYNRRPNNIDVNETVAWVYYNQNKAGKAIPYIKEALKTNCKNPTLLAHAALIFARAGDKVLAKNYLEQVSSSKAYISASLQTETLHVIQDLLIAKR
ncbi:tetratricopeptide repeat protein [Segetibacter koreensis]|uniref:tetratricopeptide repeat protein n=1 Tax=Segetibacter koreensis TaxID=398037 RepID=UPI00035EEEB3|nr:tetratricopeptide repeat protein [Segetibacter koreensis]